MRQATYLVESVRMHPDQETLKAMFAEAALPGVVTATIPGVSSRCTRG